MKKNMMSVIILALVFANFVLTAILIFTILPETKKANQMIESVCSAVDLELNSGAASGISNIPIDQIEEYNLNNGDSMTMSFAVGEDGKNHYLVAKVSLSMNNKSEGYSTYGSEGLAAKESIIKSDINSIVHQYTMDEFNQDHQKVFDAIKEELQDMFGGDFIVGVNFSETLTE